MTHVIEPTRLWVPPRTLLMTVWRLPGGQWQVWTSCPDRNAPFDKMLGTALLLDPDGAAYRIVNRPDGNDQCDIVLPPFGDPEVGR